MDTTRSDKEMKDYYAERAPVYDRVYSYPERQDDLRYLEAFVPEQFVGKDVLEIAAGTGYWTNFISRGAKSITATDATQEALVQIQHRDTRCPIEVKVADAYTLENVVRNYDGAFAGLWFSHIPVERREEWFAVLHRHLNPGANVLILDNSEAQCERLPITHTDAKGNTFQTRQTDAQESYDVLKNFPTEKELLSLTKEIGGNHKHEQLDHFWLFQYDAK